jgi:hypothetical protein
MIRLRLLISFMSVVGAAMTVPRLLAESNVRVHVADAYGTPLPMAQIAISNATSVIRLKQDETVRIENGGYTLRVEVPGFSSTIVPVTVDQPEQVFAVAMRLGRIEGDRPVCSVIGRVRPGRAPIRLKLIELHGTYSVDVPPVGNGAFAFRNLECGAYLLVAIDPGGCRGTMVVVAKPVPKDIDLELTKSESSGCNTIN